MAERIIGAAPTPQQLCLPTAWWQQQQQGRQIGLQIAVQRKALALLQGRRGAAGQPLPVLAQQLHLLLQGPAAA
jgi:hypothetical protein